MNRNFDDDMEQLRYLIDNYTLQTVDLLRDLDMIDDQTHATLTAMIDVKEGSAE